MFVRINDSAAGPIAPRRSYIIMEFIDGLTLRRAQLELRKFIECIRDVSLALHEDHEVGIIHRDIKPENILVHPDGRARLVDFGVARIRGTHDDHERGGSAGRNAALHGPRAFTGRDRQPSPRDITRRWLSPDAQRCDAHDPTGFSIRVKASSRASRQNMRWTQSKDCKP